MVSFLVLIFQQLQWIVQILCSGDHMLRDEDLLLMLQAVK